MKKYLATLALLALTLAACGSTVTQNIDPDLVLPDSEKVLAVIGANFTDPIGTLSAISLDDAKTLTQNFAATNTSDVVLKRTGKLLFAINRYGSDSIQVFDPKDNFNSLADYSVGAGSNPQDILVFGDKAYLSRLTPGYDVANQSDVLVIDHLTGAVIKGFDLKSYMTEDGEQLAFAAQMARVGQYLYVACQDLSSWWVADTNGKVIVIDTVTDEVVKSIELTGRNPADIVYSADTNKIYVADTGMFENFVVDTSKDQGGIEVIDPDTNESLGIMVDDKDLGGYVSELRIFDATTGYILTNSAVLASFNPSTYAVENGSIYSSTGFYVPDFEVNTDGTIILTERGAANSGIVFINPDGSIASGPISIGALPASVEIVEINE